MRIPISTYRLQFHAGFNFAAGEHIMEYLESLGISDIYSSPVLQARSGSMHCYDGVDPLRINEEFGGKEGFLKITSVAKKCSLGWIQDIVPNHMAFDPENYLLMDLFENAENSRYARFFDIDWDHPYQNLKGKILAPFLGEFYGNCLDKNEIRLIVDQNGFAIRYYEWQLPLRITSYYKVLIHDLMTMEKNMSREDDDHIAFLEIIQNLKQLADVRNPEDHYALAALIKSRIWKLYSGNEFINNYINRVIEIFNGRANDPQSLNNLDDLLSEQIYRLAFWKVGNEELNYRRFFTINGLICLRMEEKEVFDHVHDLVFQMIKEGWITGLRIDHVDGLYEPVTYLHRLREREREIYLIVEKILDFEEELPESMPVQGTTGYDFMNMVNGIFIARHNEKNIDRAYKLFTGRRDLYHEMVSVKKRLFMGKHMAGDIDNLAHLLKRILNRNRYGKDMTMYGLRKAIVEIMAQFPVYRSYISEANISDQDSYHVKEAMARAKNHNPDMIYELDFIEKVLLLEFGKDISSEEKNDYYHFTKRFQQFSGPLMAKGAEDTTFYIYNRFISLNEVGGNPSLFGISPEEFHKQMILRQQKQPYSLNATSTHDTKRGEDTRARLNVLSELPHEWLNHVRQWSRINGKKKKIINGQKAPDKNDEYFIYQTLLGIYPLDIKEEVTMKERMTEYVIKAIREAEVHTAWIKPDANYENACMEFVRSILAEGENLFLQSFLPFMKKIAFYGIFNSLSQLILKLTCPGIPDIYQGTELWDFTLVDPDNRRLVDYARRKVFIHEMQANRDDLLNYIDQLWNQKENGKIKMFLMNKILEIRKAYSEIFQKGEYTGLEVLGVYGPNILAFTRKCNERQIVVIVSRLIASLIKADEMPVGNEIWQDTEVILPGDKKRKWKNVLTEEICCGENRILIGEIFKVLPIAVLVETED